MQPCFSGMNRTTMWTSILQIAEIWWHLRLVLLNVLITDTLNAGQNRRGLNEILLRQCSHDAHVSLSVFSVSIKMVVDKFFWAVCLPYLSGQIKLDLISPCWSFMGINSLPPEYTTYECMWPTYSTSLDSLQTLMLVRSYVPQYWGKK